jgi:uncharacterized protein YigA (DUF484 family)
MSTTLGTQGITESDIASYLANTPAFFERHAELMASIQLTSPHGHRAVSLQERQMEMLRDKVKGMEGKVMEMIRHGQENTAIADRLHRYTRAIMLCQRLEDLPQAVEELMHQFLIPQAAVRIWGAETAYSGMSFARGVSDDAKSFASSLTLPYCGINSGFEAAQWLDDPRSVMSLALIPLRHDDAVAAFGMLVLASPDPTRYAADMGTDFLVRIGEIAAAGLSRLLGKA